MLRGRILNRRNVTGVRGDASNLVTVVVFVVHRTTAALKSLDPRRRRGSRCSPGGIGRELPRTIDDVNKRRWDYAELHRLAGGVDVGMPSPYHMVVARDGAVANPCGVVRG
jgi:hypothetical protein